MTNATLQWDDVNGQPQHAAWHSEAGRPAPARMQVADDRLAADAAYHLICEGSTLLWQGDFFNARHLMEALKRRLDKPKLRGKAQKNAKPAHPPAPAATPALAFHQQRQVQARRAHILGSILIPLNGDYRIPLRRAPDVQAACTQAWGPADGTARVIALRELQGIVSAYEWRKNGVQIPALQTLGGYDRIHPHYGVFSPVRGEYVDLVAQAPLPATATHKAAVAWDIGTGTGVLAALLARRGVWRVVASELNARALVCAQENIERLGLAGQIEIQHADLFPPGQAALIVCNPPWLPGRPASLLEQAIYDPDSRMLRGFIDGLSAHLIAGGEGWLILSDLAEHLGLRIRETLLGWFAQAGLKVLGRQDVRPQHPKAADINDPLYLARVAEITSLWRLGLNAPSAA